MGRSSKGGRSRVNRASSTTAARRGSRLQRAGREDNRQVPF
jgi:hypothetical protein